VLLNASDDHCDGRPTQQIPFDKAGRNPLLVGSNKTVIGVGATAGIKGKGLKLQGVRNVIVRNLTISDINQGIIFAGDAVTINDVDHVWIDHNRFHNIGRQMIAGGYEPARNVTISWNDFDGNNTYSHYCNGKHYWNVLLLSKAQAVTLSHNWFHDFSGRAPKIGGDATIVHVVNNYFQDGSWHALDVADPARVLVEGNVFENVKLPVMAGQHQGFIFGAFGELDAAAQAQCKAALGRSCLGNAATPPPSVNGFGVQPVVLEAFKTVPAASAVVPQATSAIPAAVKTKAGPGHVSALRESQSFGRV
jgi:pectin lyase